MSDWNMESIQNLKKHIGESLKAKRLQNNIAQKKLSELSGVSLTSIARLENGIGNISLNNLLLILKALEVTNELKIIFTSPLDSPITLAKSIKGKIQQRVFKKIESSTREWVWEEDKKC